MDVDRSVAMLLSDYEPEGFNDRLQFHPVVRRLQFAAAALRAVVRPEHESPRPRARIAVTTAVSVYLYAFHGRTVSESSRRSNLDWGNNPG